MFDAHSLPHQSDTHMRLQYKLDDGAAAHDTMVICGWASVVVVLAVVALLVLLLLGICNVCVCECSVQRL